MKKKKSLSVLLCLSLVCAMLLLFVGCGGGSKGDDDKSKKETVVGDWEGKIDISDPIREGFYEGISAGDASYGNLADYIKIGKLNVEISLALDKDDEFTMTIDEDSFDDAANKLLDNLKDGMYDYFEDVLKEMELDMSVDEYFEEALDMSFDEYMDDAATVDILMDGVDKDALKLSGTYKVDYDEEELILKVDGGGRVKLTFELDGDTLTLDGDADDFEVDNFIVFPLELERW